MNAPSPWLTIAPADRASRLQFLEIGDDDRRRLGELAEALLPHLMEVIDRWYEYLLARPETRDLLDRGRVKEHLRGAQAGYFGELLAGPYDDAYFEQRLRIGFIHERVGLQPAWYTGSYRKFQDLARTFLVERGHPTERVVAWMRAFEKVIYLDMELALDAYFQTAQQGLVDANAALRRLTGELETRNRELVVEFERAQEAARLKAELLSRVSHELRTPLHAVLGYADLLLDGIEGPLSEEQARSVSVIRSHGRRLLAMIEGMIDTAKAAAAPDVVAQPFDPGPAVARALAAGRAAADTKGLSVEDDLPAALPEVLGEESGFEMALSHLLENAAKFTAAGGVKLEASREGGMLRFFVSDTGPGIPEAHRELIFEPFHQVDEGDTRTTTGLGIGLTIARQALERMGGSLCLETSGPEGSCFSLELPIHEPSNDAP